MGRVKGGGIWFPETREAPGLRMSPPGPDQDLILRKIKEEEEKKE